MLLRIASAPPLPTRVSRKMPWNLTGPKSKTSPTTALVTLTLVDARCAAPTKAPSRPGVRLQAEISCADGAVALHRSSRHNNSNTGP